MIGAPVIGRRPPEFVSRIIVVSPLAVRYQDRPSGLHRDDIGFRSPPTAPRAGLLLGFLLGEAPAIDGFATKAPVGADLESGEFTLLEQAVDGRGMAMQELGEFADSHDVTLRRPLYPLVHYQNRRFLSVICRRG